jgi:RecA-family ATPase
MLDACLGWIEAGVPFRVFMLEEDRTYYLRRAKAMLAGESGMVDLRWAKVNHAKVVEATQTHGPTLAKLGEAIQDAPDARVTLPALADWYESVAGESRVVIIDPVTAASTDKNRWIEDGEFVGRVKTIARKSGSSLILVTHPKLGRRNGPPTLEDFAGGADYPRFTQTAISLFVREDEGEVMCSTTFGRVGRTPNRIIRINKARNGRGTGADIAFNFDPETLNFHEIGLVVDE